MEKNTILKRKKPEEIRSIQKSVYRKIIEAIGKSPDPSFENLRKLVTDKSLPKTTRFSRDELEVASLYFDDKTAEEGSRQFAWDVDYPLEQVSHNLFTRENLDILRKEFSNTQYRNSSLIPIKGISKALQAKLRNLHIYDTPTLLVRGRSYNKRVALAKKLDVDVKLVSSWVKQADLWRVEGMTTDMAYLLVMLGVRHVYDLAKVDEEKAYPMLEGISASQPDFLLDSKIKLAVLIDNANMLVGGTKANFTSIMGAVKRAYSLLDTIDIPEEKTGLQPKRNVFEEQKNSLGNLIENAENQINFGRSRREITIETLEKAPWYLFKSEYVFDPVGDNVSGEIIKKGLGFLDDIPYELPLPRTISGKVYMRKADEKNQDKKPLPGVLVEIDGIVSPSDDKQEIDKKPSCLTDSRGKFILVMPDRYSLKETIKIIISQGSKKQEFIKNASEVLEAVEERKQLEQFYLLDSIGDEIDLLDEQIRHYQSLLVRLDQNPTNQPIVPQGRKKEHYKEEIEKLLKGNKETGEIGLIEQYKELNKGYVELKSAILQGNYEERKDIILESTDTRDIKKAFDSFLASCTHLDAELEGDNFYKGNEGFVIIEEIFNGYRTDIKKALPSVKLMGNEDSVIRLSTDTVPSRVFNYSMLQRLVEPEIFPKAEDKGSGRKTLNRPLDIEDFKQQLYITPNDEKPYPQMSSLGIGYILNMHQAWVPDGFALGTLLYSAVLAPGEEQRLIVRENKHRYSLSDKSSGTDAVSENYAISQEDDTTAAFNYAVNQLSKANSHYSYSADTSSYGGGFGVGAIFGPVAIMGGFSGGSSEASGRGSSSARQSNAHNEASNAAQNFQHSIKSASDRISQSKRISMQSATSEVSDSVATKIIANHNHSHAMTIQYWEVMRRYRMETCIDSVDLVLFIPLKLIRFLPQNQSYQLHKGETQSFDKNKFNKRYGTLLKYANSLKSGLPHKHRVGLNLIKQYAAHPNWSMEELEKKDRTLTLEFNSNLLSCDDITVSLVLKHGKGVIAPDVEYERIQLNEQIETSRELKQEIRDIRNNPTPKQLKKVKCTFSIPANLVNDDFSHIRVNYSCEGLNYILFQNGKSLAKNGKTAQEEYEHLMHKYWDSVKDRDDTAADLRKMEYIKSILPEAFVKPNVTLSPREVKKLGLPTIRNVSLKFNAQELLSTSLSSSTLNTYSNITINANHGTLRYADFQKMEALLHHVASETLHYSKVVWSGLSADERVMLLEQYTINMDFTNMAGIASGDDSENNEYSEDNTVDIPLLNCVNVKRLLGFYGNCMLLPFTYPKELAKKLGKTSFEVQGALYRYHSNNFRAPTTTISLPTDGMIGEAVLGETNVSEKIDLTRFWNWKDSPIDKMNIDSSYLNSSDYLAGKKTKDISALNLQGATAPNAVTVPDLISALVNKQAPNFKDITGLDQLKDVLNEGTKSAAAGRDNVISASTDLAKSALTGLLQSKNTPKNEGKNTGGGTSGGGDDSADEGDSGGGTSGSGGGNNLVTGGGTSGGGGASGGGGTSGDGDDPISGGDSGGGTSGGGTSGGGNNPINGGNSGGGGTSGDGDDPVSGGNSGGGTSADNENTDPKGDEDDPVNNEQEDDSSDETTILKNIISAAIQSSKEGKTPLEFYEDFTGQKRTEEEIETIVSAYMEKIEASYDLVTDKLSVLISKFL